MRRTVRGLVAVLAVCGPIAACKDVTGPEGNTPASLTIAPVGVIQSIGQEVTFAARVFDRSGQEMTGVTLDWVVDNGNILEVVRPGVFRSRGNGSSTVRARTASGIESQITIQVIQTPAQLQLNSNQINLWALRQTHVISAAVLDSIGTPMAEPQVIVWTSESPGIASVDGTGRVRAEADGSTTVVVRGGGLSASLPVSVSATIPYVTCFSFSLGPVGNSQQQCAGFNIVVQE